MCSRGPLHNPLDGYPYNRITCYTVFEISIRGDADEERGGSQDDGRTPREPVASGEDQGRGGAHRLQARLHRGARSVPQERWTLMSKQIECVKFGSHGQGSLRKFADSEHWISCYHVNGREHRESTGTPDLKIARRFHKQKLDEIAAHRQGLRKFIAPVHQRVTVADLLADF